MLEGLGGLVGPVLQIRLEQIGGGSGRIDGHAAKKQAGAGVSRILASVSRRRQDPTVKKTDLEKLKGLKLANERKRQDQRTGKQSQPGGGKAVPRSKLLTALLDKPAPDDKH
ncbi:hypothetical protein MAFF211271_42180 (plasmid) [Ralstonia syzygii subsp. indonesiensis]|nr:hypothetical protein MAFF211271_42180 [Ralstonia pseudosolanacearum]